MAGPEHTRSIILNPTQHLLLHDFSEVAFSHEALPNITTASDALNYILAVLYPNTKDAVATTAALPVLANTINDFRVVLDDGDGKAAAYRWEQREGEVAAGWHKIYDMDWGEGSILSNFLDKTQDVYTYKYGIDDTDAAGAPLAGVEAGQHLYGGATAAGNLTLHANSGDGVGASTGYVQVDDNFRPKTDSAVDCGTTTERWKKVWADDVQSGTLNATSGSITDSSGAISFGDENLSTTGNVTAVNAYATTAVEVGPVAGNALLLAPGSIKDESGAISFDNENLTTTGNITGATGYLTTGLEVGPTAGSAIILAPGSITDETGAISFGDENLSTTGNVTSANQYATSSIEVGTLIGNALILAAGSIKDESGAISFDNENLSTTGTLGAGATTITSLDVDDIQIDGQTISTDNGNKNIILDPNGTGLIEAGSGVFPTNDSSDDLGKTGKVWNKLWIDGYIGDGVSEITLATLLSLKDINTGIASGDTLFWDGAKWNPSHPDTEIDHGSVTGLADDDHTQYALLAGRAGGQSLVGGTAASQNLTLESTSNATKGSILSKDNIAPFTNASYSGGWAGTDLGDATHNFKDIYSKGEAKGLRLENRATAAFSDASGQNVGRAAWNTTTNKLRVDNGSAWVNVSASCYEGTIVSTAAEDTFNVDVSSVITDARSRCIWQLKDNGNDYEVVLCSLKATSASNVRISVDPPLPAGTYTLVGIEV